MKIQPKKIAFVVGMFPVISETWLIDQVAELKEHGIEVQVFSLRRGDSNGVSDKFYNHKMAEYTHYLDMPSNLGLRFIFAVPKALHLLVRYPVALLRSLNFIKYGRQALSLQLLFWAEPFLGKKIDLIHCHFGTVAVRFLAIRQVLGLKQKMVTSFYGQDVSMIFQTKGAHYYDELKKTCDSYIVMSEYMKKRVVAYGFDASKVHVISIFGINVQDYPFKERVLQPGDTIQLATVGRFVEKKGFDDLLRAVAVVKQKTDKPFMCNIIGGGELESQLKALTKELSIEDVVTYKGIMKLEDIIKYFLNIHIYLQPSKIAADGDQE